MILNLFDQAEVSDTLVYKGQDKAPVFWERMASAWKERDVLQNEIEQVQ